MENLNAIAPAESTVNLTASVRYKLSQAGQRASLLAGGDGKEEQTAVGTIAQSDIDLFNVERDGGLSFYLSGEYLDAPQTISQLIVLERGRIKAKEDRDAAEAAEKAADKRAAEAELVEFEAAFLAHETAVLGSNWDAGFRATVYAEHAVKEIRAGKNSFMLRISDAVFQENARRHKVRFAQQEAREAAAAAEKERRESAKVAQIADWVTAHGDDNQKGRHKAGLLPREEIVAAMKNAAFAPLGAAFAEFERITAADFDGEYIDDADMDCSTDDAESVTAAEWAQIEQAREILTNGAGNDEILEIRIRHHECSAADETVTRRGLYVKLQAGAFTFNREYAVN